MSSKPRPSSSSGSPDLVGPLPKVLSALQDPIRLEMVRRLSNAGAAVPCAALYDSINKSTATHHFRILSAAGLLRREVIGGQVCQRLRTDAIDAALPGLLDAVVRGANLDAQEPSPRR